MSLVRITIAMLVGTGVAVADPAPDPIPTFVLQTTLFDEPTPPPPVPSLRIEAARVAEEYFENQWRYPEPGTLGGYDTHGFYFGQARYRPRTRRSAALHAGSIGATLLGEVLLQAGSPLAGLGALVTGATLDAAAADADRDAEAARSR